MNQLYRPAQLALSHLEVDPSWIEYRKRLVACFPMVWSTDSLFELVTGSQYPVIADWGSSPTTFADTTVGPGIDFSSNSLKYNTGNTFDIDGAGKFSFFGIAAATNFYSAVAGDDTDITCPALIGSSDIRVYLSTSLTHSLSRSATAGAVEWYGWVKTTSGTSTQTIRVFYNGSYSSQDTSIGVDSTLSLFTTIGRRNSNSTEMRGPIVLMCLFDGALSDAEMERLYYQDPWGPIRWSPRTVVQGWRAPGGAPPAAEPRNLALLGVGS
jgi:hypothetical protein